MISEQSIASNVPLLARAQGGVPAMEISAIRRLQGGKSSEIWAFDARWTLNGDPVECPMVLRSGLANEFAFTGRGIEFDVLRRLEGSGLPVPRVHWFDGDGHYFGRPAMVMDRCAGTGDRNLMGARNKLGLSEGERVVLGRQAMEMLARLHAVDGAALAVGGAQALSAADHLRQHDEAIARLEVEPMVELRYASWWLWRNLPVAPEHPSIVHGDFRPANLLVEGASISAILDWEFAHLGDPAEDLGWYVTPYYAQEHLVPGAFGVEDALRCYEAARGVAVDRAAVRFWSIFAIYKLAYMTMAAIRWQIDGEVTRMAASAKFILRPLLSAIAANGPVAGR